MSQLGFIVHSAPPAHRFVAGKQAGGAIVPLLVKKSNGVELRLAGARS